MVTREKSDPISIVPIPVYSDNYAWVIRNGLNAAVIDPGEADPIKRFIEQNPLRLSAILVTHHHADHCGGAAALKTKFGCPVIGAHDERMTFVDDALFDGESRTVAGLRMKAIAAPGHTLSHFVYFFPDLKVLFTGDTLFGAGCGRLSEGGAQQMYASLAACVSLGDDILVYCGHEYTEENLRFAEMVEPGNTAVKNRIKEVKSLRKKGLPSLPVTIAVERATNPFLRTGDWGIRKWLALENTPDVEVFAELRRRKDRW